MREISRETLHEYISSDKTDNLDPSRGIAIISVSPQEIFNAGHIPSSVNIPFDDRAAKVFEDAFDKDKEIVVYSRSVECPLAAHCADTLAALGFANVGVYRGGMREWTNEAKPIERGEGSVREIPIA